MEVLDRLIGAVRRCCEGFADPRTGHNGSYTMADFGLAAFSVFFAQSPSFLAHQRQLEAGHEFVARIGWLASGDSWRRWTPTAVQRSLHDPQ
jgi:hypothetical protein